MKFYLWNLKVKSIGINGLKPSIRQLFYPASVPFLVFGPEKSRHPLFTSYTLLKVRPLRKGAISRKKMEQDPDYMLDVVKARQNPILWFFQLFFSQCAVLRCLFAWVPAFCWTMKDNSAVIWQTFDLRFIFYYPYYY